MSIKVDTNYTAFFSLRHERDSEWKRIIERLWNEFGIRSSGNKELDKQKLHELELKKANNESSVSNKFLTVKKAEQEKIQAKKKNKTDDKEQNKPDKMNGAEILGKQIFLAIQMKTEEDNQFNKRKRNNKYQT